MFIDDGLFIKKFYEEPLFQTSLDCSGNPFCGAERNKKIKKNGRTILFVKMNLL